MPNIRLMRPADYDAVHALWLRTPGMGLNDVDDSREGIAKFLARNPATCFVAEEDGQIAGVILTGHDGRRGYIYHTAVDAPPSAPWDRPGVSGGHARRPRKGGDLQNGAGRLLPE